jgi:hypothetical protein
LTLGLRLPVFSCDLYVLVRFNTIMNFYEFPHTSQYRGRCSLSTKILKTIRKENVEVRNITASTKEVQS